MGRPAPGTRVLLPKKIDGGPVGTVQSYRSGAPTIPVLDDYGVPHRLSADALRVIPEPGYRGSG